VIFLFWSMRADCGEYAAGLGANPILERDPFSNTGTMSQPVPQRRAAGLMDKITEASGLEATLSEILEIHSLNHAMSATIVV